MILSCYREVFSGSYLVTRKFSANRILLRCKEVFSGSYPASLQGSFQRIRSCFVARKFSVNPVSLQGGFQRILLRGRSFSGPASLPESFQRILSRFETFTANPVSLWQSFLWFLLLPCSNISSKSCFFSVNFWCILLYRKKAYGGPCLVTEMLSLYPARYSDGSVDPSSFQ